MACPYPSTNVALKMTTESAAVAAADAVSDGHCAVVAASMTALLPLLPAAAVPSLWYSVSIW
jgi:hypothetical protein